MKTRRTLVLLWVAVGVVAISGCDRKYTATAFLRVSGYHPDFAPEDVQAKVREEYRAYREEQRGLLTSKLVLMVALGKPQVAALPSVQSQLRNGNPITWLAGIVKVKCPGDTEVMSVSCTMSDPHEAVTLTNAVVDAYMTEIVTPKQETKKRKVEAVDLIIRDKEMQIQRERAALNRLTSVSSADNVKSPSSMPDSAEAAKLRSEIKSLEAALPAFRDTGEKMRIELKMQPRITVIERAEEPAGVE